MKKCLNYKKFYLLEIAFPLVHIFFKIILFLSNKIGRLIRIPSEIKAIESVVNLATPQSDDTRARIDSCMTTPI